MPCCTRAQSASITGCAALKSMSATHSGIMSFLPNLASAPSYLTEFVFILSIRMSKLYVIGRVYRLCACVVKPPQGFSTYAEFFTGTEPVCRILSQHYSYNDRIRKKRNFAFTVEKNRFYPTHPFPNNPSNNHNH